MKKRINVILSCLGLAAFVACGGSERQKTEKTKRRTPEWIMNMMLDPATMLEKDPDAKALSKDFSSPMVSLGLQREEARAILEYLRERNSGDK